MYMYINVLINTYIILYIYILIVLHILLIKHYYCEEILSHELVDNGVFYCFVLTYLYN